MVPRKSGFLRGLTSPPPLPSWLTQADVDFYVAEFKRTGFRGGLNWYRNIDRGWELLRAVCRSQGDGAGALHARRPRSGDVFPGHGPAVAESCEIRAATAREPSSCPVAVTGPSRSVPAEVNAAMIDLSAACSGRLRPAGRFRRPSPRACARCSSDVEAADLEAGEIAHQEAVDAHADRARRRCRQSGRGARRR